MWSVRNVGHVECEECGVRGNVGHGGVLMNVDMMECEEVAWGMWEMWRVRKCGV